MITYNGRYGFAIQFDTETEEFLNSLSEEEYEDLKEQIHLIEEVDEFTSDMVSLNYSLDDLYFSEGEFALEEGKEWFPPRELKSIENQINKIIDSFKKA